MEDSTKDKVKGNVDQASGKVKEKLGQATDNPDLEAEGTGERIKGKVQEKVGDIKKVFEK
ncbi:MAG: CsbD family protein [Verrucomicrobia bacterium]|nr:CsbD family protein [Verrucomicrobiota bacterium]